MSIPEDTANGGTVSETIGEGPVTQSGANSPDPDTIFDVLRNERRRFVLQYLDQADGAVGIGELSEAMAEYESDDGTFDHQARKRAYVALYQAHLPKMADVGVIEYDKRSSHARLTPEFDHLRPYLYDRQEPSIPWNRLYLVAGLTGIGIVVPGYLWSTATAIIPAEFWVGVLVGMSCLLIAIYLVVSTDWVGTEWYRVRDR